MKKSLMPFEAFKLAIKTMEGKNPGMPAWQIADHFPREGGILIDHGFLVEGPVDTVVPNRSNYDHDFVEAEWNEVTGGYQYYSFDDNRWIDVPAEDLKTYRLDMERVVRHIQELVGITGIHNKSWTTTEGVHREGQPFHKAALYRILKNPVYIGEVVYREVAYPGKHQAIVARDLWEGVHGLIAEHVRPCSTLPRGQTPFPLKGLVRCGHCGMAMKPSHSRKNGQVQYRYYICINAARTSHDQCTLPSIPAGELERLVLNRVRKILKSPEVVARAIRQVRKADPEMSEREIIDLLTRLDPVWEELFPLEQNRLLKLLVETLVVTANGVDLQLQVAGLGTLVGELSGQPA